MERSAVRFRSDYAVISVLQALDARAAEKRRIYLQIEPERSGDR